MYDPRIKEFLVGLCRTRVMAHATAAEELAPRLPAHVSQQILEFGLYIQPGLIKAALQEATDATVGEGSVVPVYVEVSPGREIAYLDF